MPDNALGCTCKTSLCNKEDCPQSRLKCHQCEGPDCVELAADDEKITCRNYDPNDQCFTVVDDSVAPPVAYRGCMSDIETVGIEKCKDLAPFCVAGDDNDQPGYNDEFGCVQCDSSIEGDKCATDTERKSCGDIPLGSQVQCYTISTGEQIIRDCYYGAKEQQCKDAGPNCDKCSTDGCNNESFKSLKCRKCDPCTTENEKETGLCFVKPENDDDLACYHRVDGNYHDFFYQPLSIDESLIVSA